MIIKIVSLYYDLNQRCERVKPCPGFLLILVFSNVIGNGPTVIAADDVMERHDYQFQKYGGRK